MHKFLSLLLVLGLVFTLSACQNQEAVAPEDPPPDNPAPVEPEPEIEPSPEEIIAVEPELEGAIMAVIDNHEGARPQHNLDKADIVYEFICESGITRLVAAYYTEDPGTIGPIRSARYYFVELVKAYGAPFAHIGGNMDAMALIKELKVRDLCGITNAGGYFDRNKARYQKDPGRKPPHNTYTDSELMIKGAKAKGYPLAPLPELPLGELNNGKEAGELKLVYSTSAPKNIVEWVYQPEDQKYWRYVNGSPQRTYDSENILADNIIVIEAAVKTVPVPIDIVQSEIDIIGSGRALFFRNGQMYQGQWRKGSANEHFQYTLDDGSEFKYAPGKVWIQHIPSIDDVTVK